jgi:hypothetical protein
MNWSSRGLFADTFRKFYLEDYETLGYFAFGAIFGTNNFPRKADEFCA